MYLSLLVVLRRARSVGLRRPMGSPTKLRTSKTFLLLPPKPPFSSMVEFWFFAVGFEGFDFFRHLVEGMSRNAMSVCEFGVTVRQDIVSLQLKASGRKCHEYKKGKMELSQMALTIIAC